MAIGESLDGASEIKAARKRVVEHNKPLLELIELNRIARSTRYAERCFIRDLEEGKSIDAAYHELNRRFEDAACNNGWTPVR